MEAVKLLYKKGETIYRPVSLLTVLSKVHNKARLSRLSQNLYPNILVTEQHGFGKHKSSESTTFRLTDSVFKYINQKHVAGIVHDLAKAFDCMNHEILSAELYFYGIPGVSEDWFRSCLTNSRQKVTVK